MGPETIITAIEVIWSGAYQIDFKEEGKGHRVFIDPDELYSLIAEAHKKNSEEIGRKHYLNELKNVALGLKEPYKYKLQEDTEESEWREMTPEKALEILKKENPYKL